MQPSPTFHVPVYPGIAYYDEAPFVYYDDNNFVAHTFSNHNTVLT